MATDSAALTAALERLSALADGELDETQVAQACQQWRGDGELRSSWHAYQLIGDVLRSDDLSSDPGHDAAFLAAFRARIAGEPVVLAPSPVPPARVPAVDARQAAGAPLRRRAWMTPSAVAAGFVAVAGVLFVTRAPDVTPSVPLVASASASDGSFATAAARSPVAVATVPDLQPRVASGKLIRDVRLDRYLSAHKEFAGSSALGVPSGFLRNATADASDR